MAEKKEKAQQEKLLKEVSALKSKPVITEKPSYLKNSSMQSKETYVSKNELTQKYYEHELKVDGHRTDKLYNFAKIKQQHNDEMLQKEDEIKAEIDIIPCTFEPEIHPNNTAKPEDAEPDAPGMQKAVARILKGREMSETLQKMREKGNPNSNTPTDDAYILSGEAPHGAVYEIDVTIGDSVEKVKTTFNQIEKKVKELVRKHNMELGSEKRLVLELQSKLVQSNLLLFAPKTEEIKAST